jgi:hypothetical protein
MQNGHLPAWQGGNGKPAERFVVKIPSSNPASFDANHRQVGVLCRDSEPDPVRRPERVKSHLGRSLTCQPNTSHDYSPPFYRFLYLWSARISNKALVKRTR